MRILFLLQLAIVAILSSRCSAVVGGANIQISDHPYAVGLYENYQSTSFKCAGSIISETNVLVDSSCCTGIGYVRLGSTNLSEGKSIKVEKCDAASNLKVAVITVAESLYEHGGKPVKLLQDKDQDTFIGQKATLVGWGVSKTSEWLAQGPTPEQLSMTDVTLIEFSEFEKLYGHALSMGDEKQFIFGKSHPSFPTKYDNGMSLTVTQGSDYVALGVFMLGREASGSNEAASYYAKIGMHREFIDAHAKGHEWFSDEVVTQKPDVSSSDSPSTPDTPSSDDDSSDSGSGISTTTLVCVLVAVLVAVICLFFLLPMLYRRRLAKKKAQTTEENSDYHGINGTKENVV